MQASTLSVVIPNYNNEKYLQKCLDSIVMQTYPIKEIIVVDDCSTDQSLCVVREMAQKYTEPLIKLVSLKENGGVSHARNVGLQMACGEYITFLDADDYWADYKKIEREMHLINERKKEGMDVVAYSKVIHVNETGEILDDDVMSKCYTGNIFLDLLKTYETRFIPRDYCVKTEKVKEAGGYREDMSLYEDYELTLRLSREMCFYCTNENGTAYRIKENGLSHKTIGESDAVFWRIFRENIADMRPKLKIKCFIFKWGAWIYKRTKVALYNRIVSHKDKI